MARTYAPLMTSIWSDPDFTALSAAAQRLYLLAISQPNISYCGVVPFTARRWARMGADVTAGEVLAAVTELEVAGFVLVDGDTEELWVRSFVRHNGVLSQPNIAKRMDAEFAEIFSERIRTMFLAEMPGDLPAGCDRISTARTNPSGNPSRNPSGNPSEGQAEGFPEPPGSGSGSGSGPGSTDPTPSSVTEPHPVPPSDDDDDLDRELVDAVVALKVTGQRIDNPGPYRAAVARSVPVEHGDDLRRVLAEHPAWPTNWVAAHALGLERTDPSPAQVIADCPDCTNGLIDTGSGMAVCPACSWARNGNRTGEVR